MNLNLDRMAHLRNSIFIGYDPRETDAFLVTRITADRSAPLIKTHGIILDEMRDQGLYHRTTERRDGRLWDVISEAPMATEFAISRFLTPHLARRGWALFMDCDMLVRGRIDQLFSRVRRDFADKALVCVPHKMNDMLMPGTKMDGQVQTRYHRKNWSSFMLFNCEHPANQRLTIEMINEVPGRELHQFCWLQDEEIGHIGPEWNYLVGHTDPHSFVEPVMNVHFTNGVPSMAGYDNVEFADEWRKVLREWVRNAYYGLPYKQRGSA